MKKKRNIVIEEPHLSQTNLKNNEQIKENSKISSGYKSCGVIGIVKNEPESKTNSDETKKIPTLDELGYSFESGV